MEQIRSATRVAFDNLISQAIEEEVSFVIIAGDLYDGDWRDFQTGLFFSHQMGRLGKVGIEVFLLYGNHDAESQITKRLSLPENVKVFPSRNPGTFALDELSVVLHGQSFRQRDVTENLVPQYPDPVEGMFNIGVLHTALGGLGGHENYAPCSLDDLVAKGYDYWALGHVHNGQILHEHPHVVFPGNIQGRHIRETGPKGAQLVTVEDRQIAEFTSLFPDVARWARLPVSVEKCARTADVIDRVRQAIEEAVSSEADGRLLACRIELRGQTSLHAELLVSMDHLLAEARSAALSIGADAAWIEKLVVATEPALDHKAAAGRQDALGELQRMIGEAGSDEGLVGKLEADIAEMVRKLPLDLRKDVEDPVLRSAMEGDYAALIAHVADYLNGRLIAGERS
ncbi:Metallophosphoesterase [Nitrococcus mobilis Nb-231]|uniref:Metallophosphoesterase n=1 Tax=Nitrococcus mobilis Nb-231 TaxID=314278 RepID=A4BLD7_9GAMM|nr:Metallophosphoesterase [Nitrococcus mobilis Nb-231]